MAEARAAARIGAEIIPAGVVRHQHHDVRPLLWLGRRWSWRLRLARRRQRFGREQRCRGSAQ
jgi:hypothetical protein